MPDSRQLSRTSLFVAHWTVVALVGLVVASPAGAAAQIGETFVPTVGDGNVTFLQTGSPGGQYTVPSAGVITSWSYQAPASPPPVKLKVGRPAGGNNFTIVGDSPLKSPTASQLNTYTDVRVPVEAGDVIGIYVGVPDGFIARAAPATYTLHYVGGDQPPATTTAFIPLGAPYQFDVSAALEPDADNDGFGDETQDQCPTSAATQNECVAPQTQITKGPKDKTKKKTATFEFSSPSAGATFECSLDGATFAACTSPETVKVKKGKHHFEVRAVAHGLTDSSTASDDWKVKKKK